MSAQLVVVKNFDEIFTIVKRAVQQVLDLHRAGLTLVLAELPNAVGAYHIMGSNIIVVNRTVLNAVRELSSSEEEFNSFVFMIITHEYLHSLGEVNEARVRSLVRKVCIEFFGPDHISVKMADGNFMEKYPQLKFLGRGKYGSDFQIIRDFDRSSMPYIG